MLIRVNYQVMRSRLVLPLQIIVAVLVQSCINANSPKQEPADISPTV